MTHMNIHVYTQRLYWLCPLKIMSERMKRRPYKDITVKNQFAACRGFGDFRMTFVQLHTQLEGVIPIKPYVYLFTHFKLTTNKHICTNYKPQTLQTTQKLHFTMPLHSGCINL